MTDTRTEYVAGLRAVADLLEQHPDVELPTHGREVEWLLFNVTDAATEKARAAAIVTTLGGDWRKWETGKLFRYSRQVHGLTLTVIVDRATVCQRVVTGTVEVKVERPVTFETVTETQETAEWVCQPLLAAT